MAKHQWFLVAWAGNRIICLPLMHRISVAPYVDHQTEA